MNKPLFRLFAGFLALFSNNGTQNFNVSTYQVSLAGNFQLGTATINASNGKFVFKGVTHITDVNPSARVVSFGNFDILAGATVRVSPTNLTSLNVTGTFNAFGSSGSHVIFNSLTSSTKFKFNVTTVGTVQYVDATDIDSSEGSQIINNNGTLSNTDNWIVPVIFIKAPLPQFRRTD